MRRTARGILAVAVSALLVAGCGSDDGGDASASSSAPSASTAEESPQADLASGLLPADAFGADASVVAISPEQLAQGAGLAASNAEGLVITPEECAVAVEGTQPDFDEIGRASCRERV